MFLFLEKRKRVEQGATARQHEKRKRLAQVACHWFNLGALTHIPEPLSI